MPQPTFEAVPILRIFDVEKARAFYIDYLGFQVDWVHQFGENFPHYLQVSRNGLVLHLTEHHGDCCPGSTVFVKSTGLEALHQELTSRNDTFQKPELETAPWNARVLTVADPFGNRLRFNEPLEAGKE